LVDLAERDARMLNEPLDIIPIEQVNMATQLIYAFCDIFCTCLDDV
jgi:hypothetical protein